MSPRGTPDWGQSQTEVGFSVVDDLSEIPARLGSPVTHDRRGRVIFIDSFEHGMASWETTEAGAGASVALSVEQRRTGAYSVKMVAGSDGARGAQLSRAFPYPVLSKYGLEFSVMFLSEVQYFIATLGLRDGTQEHQYQISYEPAAEEMRVTIPGGSSVAVIEDLDLSVGSGLFHTIKLVGDFENGNYERLIVNESATELTDYEPYTFAHVSSPHVNIIFSIYSDPGENDTVYIDGVILTNGEP